MRQGNFCVILFIIGCSERFFTILTCGQSTGSGPWDSLQRRQISDLRNPALVFRFTLFKVVWDLKLGLFTKLTFCKKAQKLKFELRDKKSPDLDGAKELILKGLCVFLLIEYNQSKD